MKRNLSTTLSPINANQSSLASKYGVSTKQNAPHEGLGLNPNLNIEDEYIQNLLKQIHFMNLEIKLVKQKQQQSNGNALWGLINRTNQPMVSNIVESSQKYQAMKKQSDTHLHRLEKDITGLENSQGALLNELKFLEKRKDQVRERSKKWEEECKTKHKMLDERIENNRKKLNSIKEELEKQRKKNKQLNDANNKSVNQDEMDRSKQQKQRIQIKNDQMIQETIHNELNGQIALLKVMTAGLIKSFQENPDYILAKQEEAVLKQKVLKLEKDILGVNFDLIQLNESIKMAELQKDKEIKERKRLTEEFEQKKTMLEEIKKLNESRKEKQLANRRKESPQILKAQEQTVKLERSLQEIKKKLLKNEEANLLASNEVMNYEREIQNIKQSESKLNQLIKNLRETNSQLETQRSNFNTQLMLTINEYDKTLQTETSTSLQLFQLEREIHYLRERRDLLSKNLQLKEVINGLKIQDLERVVQKNKELNSTVAKLMSKWDQIKDFSKI